MSFMSELKTELNTKYNISRTENGALGYATCHPLVDMNFKVTSYRNCSENEIVGDFIKALNEDFALAVAWMFYARDVREGLGERRLFRTLFKYLAETHPDLAKQLLEVIAEYGRWDDLMILLDTPIHKEVVALIKKQLMEDAANSAAGKSISLLAKWMPSANTSSRETRAQANILIKALEVSPRNYRKLLSKLRAYLNVIEAKMSANEWDQINYEAVPSKANLIYKEAFLEHDKERREEYLSKLQKGEVKINASAAFPHDIVHKYGCRSYSIREDATIEAMWRALPDLGLEDTLCVADGSGSMFTRVDQNSGVMAIEVANALALYTAQHCQGEFKNTYITFSSRPQLVHLKGKTLADNLALALQHNEVANTNIKAVFELILRTAVNARMTQEEMPKNILIISDMEFDSATRGFGSIDERLFDRIQREYAEAGYLVPKLIFWNVCGRTHTIPMVQNELGVNLVSGFSANILKAVMNAAGDPFEALVEVLLTERYSRIIEIVKAYRK